MNNHPPSIVSALALALALWASLAAPAAQADLPALIPRRELFFDDGRYGVSLSRDGKRVSYIAQDKEKRIQLWIKTVGQDDDKMIGPSSKSEIVNIGWQFDNKHILYRQDVSGDENWHIFQTNIETNVTRDLTPFLGFRALPVDSRPEFANVLLATINTRDRKCEDLYRINTTSGALQFEHRNPGGILQWLVDKNLEVRGWQRIVGSTHRVLVSNTSAGPFRTVITWGPEDSDGSVIGFTPDEKSILIRTSKGANTDRLLQVDIFSGDKTVLAADPQFDVGNVLRTTRTRELQAVCFEKERRQWKAVDPAVAADIEKLSSFGKGDFSISDEDIDDRLWLVQFDQDTSPQKYYVYDRKSQTVAFLFSSHPLLDKYTFSAMQSITVTARDGMKLFGYLTLPVGIEAKNLPMVLEVHGGPWSRNRWGFSPTVQWLANRGYAVLQINFRGSTGYGNDYMHAGDREWGAKMLTDLIDAKDWAIKQGYADPKRICIDGTSYGGYAALSAAAFTPGEFTCAIDSAGPSNLVTLLRSIPPIWESEKTMFAKRIGDYVREPEFLESRSPLFKADQIRIPMIISQGMNDIRVKQSEADQIVAAVRKNGKPVEYLLFPDEGHGLRSQDYSRFRARCETFLGKYLGGRVESVGEGEESDQLLH